MRWDRDVRYQYRKRRCDVEASPDNLKYHLGFAFEVNKALDLPSLALTGLLSLPGDVRLFVDRAELSAEEIRIVGRKSTLERSFTQLEDPVLGPVPVFDRQWCRVSDSNRRPTAYKAVALPAELTRRE